MKKDHRALRPSPIGSRKLRLQLEKIVVLSTTELRFAGAMVNSGGKISCGEICSKC